MSSHRHALVIALVLLAFPLTQLGAQNGSSRFGLVAGRAYTYGGTSRWTDTTAGVHASRVQWTMEVLQVRASENARAALVRGWVQELAWYTPRQRPAFSVLLEYRGGLYQLAGHDSSAALDTLIDAIRDAPRALFHFRLVIDSNLVVGKSFGGDSERRSDVMYAWTVGAKTAISDHPRWLTLATDPTRWRLEYRTMPDYQLIDFVPGLGVTRFVYEHHGTTADVDVRLAKVTSSPP